MSYVRILPMKRSVETIKSVNLKSAQGTKNPHIHCHGNSACASWIELPKGEAGILS